MSTEQAKGILDTFHNNVVGEDFSINTIDIKIMCVGYYCPTLFNGSHSLVKSCKEFQFFTGRRKNFAMPLKPIVLNEPFSQWGLEFIRMINPMSIVGHKWILTAKNYFTRWIEVIPLKNTTKVEIVDFLEELVTRFGPLNTIISNNSKAFLGTKVCHFSLTNDIFLKKSLNYYLQGNNLVESTNKNLV